MERIRSRAARALGGAGRAWGGGLLAAAVLAAVGCAGSRGTWSVSNMMPATWTAGKPATVLAAAFDPQIQHLPDPTAEGVRRPGLTGKVFLIDKDGQYTQTSGDLYIMAVDVTPRPPGHPPAVAEVWHFDPIALRKLKTKDERFGDCYALFLPYPPNWKDVTQVQVSTEFKPTTGEGGVKGTGTNLYNQPQTVTLDFTPPGQPVWADKSGPRPTTPSEVRAIPNLTKDLARSGYTAPLTDPRQNTGTVPAGGVLPPGNPNPISPAVNTIPDLPMARGPNGQPLPSAAFALPPGQDVPTGWRKEANGAIVPPANSVPWSPPAARTPPPSTPPPSTPPAPLSTFPPTSGGNLPPLPASLPPLPASTVPTVRTTQPTDPTIPAIPVLPSDASSGVIAPPPPPNFDPRSPVGAWATQPVVVPPPPPSGASTYPTVLPPQPTGPDAPLPTTTIRR